MLVDFTLNEQRVSVDVEPDTPLLWVIRDYLGLKGTKFGCGQGACGACTVHFNGQALRSCVLPAAAAAGQSVTTIEGIGDEANPHPVQQAWIEEIVPQCGYCQSGFIMAAAALIDNNTDVTDADIDNNITNVCRCATYYRMRQAIKRAAEIKEV